jgi:hypothetical protein
MGLFDKKKDDFGSPVERVDLGPPPAAQKKEAPSPAKASQPPRSPDPLLDLSIPEEKPRYGINQAIELMRSLPGDNVELVVQVVKRTLESTQIRLDTIIQDASRKQAEIEARAGILKQEIAELEREIGTRRAEIARLDADYRETSLVKDRLVLAEKLGNGSVTSAAPATGTAPERVAPERAGGAGGERAERAASAGGERTERAGADRAGADRATATPHERTNHSGLSTLASASNPATPRPSGAHVSVPSTGAAPSPTATGTHPVVRDEPHPRQTGAVPAIRNFPGSNPPKR